MTSILFFGALLLLSQVELKWAEKRFSKPSEAFAYANAPMEEWDAAVKAGPAPSREVRLRSNALCASFPLDSVSGEELYWLAKLCEYQPATGQPAVERYLAGTTLEHRPEAHLLLSDFQMRASRSWAPAWGTLRTILQEDPFESAQEVQIRVAIGDEADKDEKTALKWAEERYSLLKERLEPTTTQAPPVSAGWVVLAGTNLVHRYYLAGETERAATLLAEINGMKSKIPVPSNSWAGDSLNWANMEMKPAPSVPVLKSLGGSPGNSVVQPGRVEVLSFFFLHCSPCIREMPGLGEMQGRFPRAKVLVADITTYEAALQPQTPTHKQVESAIEKMRRKRSPHLTMLVTTKDTLNDYGIHSFPVTAVIDKTGRLRYLGVPDNHDEDEEIDLLVRRLVQE